MPHNPQQITYFNKAGEKHSLALIIVKRRSKDLLVRFPDGEPHPPIPRHAVESITKVKKDE